MCQSHIIFGSIAVLIVLKDVLSLYRSFGPVSYTHLEQPEAPRKDEYDTTEEYEQAQSEFEQDLNDYTEECEEIRTRSEAGEIILYFRIESKDIVLCYRCV